MPVFNGMARTLLLDPISGRPMVPAFPVSCISREEAMAEKLRAALSRRDVAIRDFYDIDYAVRRLGLNPSEPALIALVHQKLSVPGNDPVDVSEARLAELRQQLASQLKPVLREKDFQEFNLESVFQKGQWPLLATIRMLSEDTALHKTTTSRRIVKRTRHTHERQRIKHHFQSLEFLQHPAR